MCCTYHVHYFQGLFIVSIATFNINVIYIANDSTARPEWYSCWIRLHADCYNYIAFTILATLKSILTNIGGTTICVIKWACTQ